MKLRVLLNSMRGRQLAAMIFGGLLGLVAAILTAVSGLVPYGNPGTDVDVLASLYAAWLVGWVLAPVATGGGDETLRPEHFALLPIGKRKLAVGLLAASFVGVTSVVSLVAFLGLFFYGLRLGVGPAAIGLVFAVFQLMLVVLVYRVVMAGLGALLTSRKGKELGILLIALTGLSGIGVNYVIGSLGPAIVNGRVPAFVSVVRVLPSGWGAVAVRAAGDGDWLTALLLLLAMAALLAVLITVWGALIVKRTTSTSFRGASRTRATRARRRSLLPDTPIGAVATKELHTWWRDARRRVALLSTVMVGLVIAVAPALSGGSSPTLPFLSVLVVVFACMQAGNLYGFDGSALWHTLVVPGAERADVRGRQLGWVLIVAPLGLLLAAVLPGVTGRPSLYPWVFGLVPALVGAGAGVILLQSVYVAFPLPDPRRNASPFASGGRPGCARLLLQLSISLLLLVAALPVAVVELAGKVAHLPVLMWAGVPIGIATGGLLAWWWGQLALTRLRQRGPELLATVSKER
jgi:ABC-2 type transport system permease protein